jgi:cyanate permease
VYGPSLGFTPFTEIDPKAMAGLHGILVGVGEILAGLVFGIFGHVTNKVGRWPVVLLGTIIQFTRWDISRT